MYHKEINNWDRRWNETQKSEEDPETKEARLAMAGSMVLGAEHRRLRRADKAAGIKASVYSVQIAWTGKEWIIGSGDPVELGLASLHQLTEICRGILNRSTPGEFK